MDRIIEINGVELSFDFTDADTIDLFERALSKTQQILAEDMNSLTRSDAIRKCCYSVFDFFNTVFGEGTDKEIFGGRCSLNDCIDALAVVVGEANRQRQALTDKRVQYSPNRAQRRQA